MGINKGDKVTMEYEGRLENGEIFDSTKHGDHSHAFSFVAGKGEVIPGFDKAVLGMEKGQEKEFEIEAKDAYGEYRQELKKEIPKNALPKGQTPKEGMVLVIGAPDGRKFPAPIVGVSENSIVVDLNHPIAGKKLIFKIKILEVEAKKE